jgi:energy-coupling factor transport system substrate-specific component
MHLFVIGTASQERKKEMADRSVVGFTTVELVFIAILGVVFGIVNNLFGVVYTALNAINPILATCFAPFGMVTLLAAFIVRKPGAALLAGVINGLVQFLAGNPSGLWTVGFGLAHGLGTELVFFLFRYKAWGWLNCFLASVVDGLFNVVLVVFAFGLLAVMPFGQVLMTVVIASVASGVEAGLLGRFVGQLLLRAGLLKSFQIARQPS